MPERTTNPLSKRTGISRYDLMPRPVKAVFLATAVLAVILFVLHFLAIPIFGFILSGTFYYYLMYAVLVFNVFVGLGATPLQQRRSPPWHDYVLAFVLLGCIVYFLINSRAISMRLWEPPPDTLAFVLATIVMFISLEAGRRIGGWGYVGLLGVSLIYPMFADHLPGLFLGFRMSFADIVGDFAFGANGMLGVPAQLLGELILGFNVFSGLMTGTGAGDFFMKLALVLMGKFRGGPAKVSVIASGFFGTLSGNVIANIVGTGSFTIPAMKKLGYPAHYAGAVEACSSTGGAIMPPILGGMAFMAAIIANVEYTTIMIASLIPALLYYYGLLVQVDAYAAKTGLRGLQASEIPHILPTLKEGWIYLITLTFLTVGMVYMRWGNITPIYASVLMLLLSFASKKTRLNRAKLEEGLVQTAGLINYGTGIFLSMTLILVGLLKTGVAGSITAWVISLGGENLYLILLVGVAFNLLMGMVGLHTSAYLFLAVTMAPAMTATGHIPVVAAHLFIISYAILGGITPPVAISAFVAAGLAGAPAMRTAYTACRLGIVLVFIPVFFVLQPALIMEGPPLSIIYHFLIALLGVTILTSGLEGYMVHVGPLVVWERVVLAISGFIIALPEVTTTVAGVAVAALIIVIHLVVRTRISPAKLSPPTTRS